MNNAEYYDVLCIGFGPAGIALATAMEDAEERVGNIWKRIFLEKSQDSKWQSEMLLPETDVQHHFLRDFATPRNPRSRFTFSNYLKENGRLFSYGLLGGNTSRIEWSDYVEWVASQVSYNTLYGFKVNKIEPVVNHYTSEVELLKISGLDLKKREEKNFITRNVVLSIGRKPNIPECFVPYIGDSVFHANQFKSNIMKISSKVQPTFAVVGSGQNAIEVILYLANHFPDSKIYSIHRNAGFRLYDLGHLSNEVYFPDFVDYYHTLSNDAREKLYESIKHTTFSAVDYDVSHQLYLKIYEESILGKNRIKVLKFKNTKEVRTTQNGYQLFLEDVYNGKKEIIEVDNIILGTGLTEEKIPTMLEPLKDFIHFEGDSPIVKRNYQLATVDSFLPNIFMNGTTERTHGISDSASFSMMALKAQKILEQININVLKEV